MRVRTSKANRECRLTIRSSRDRFAARLKWWGVPSRRAAQRSVLTQALACERQSLRGSACKAGARPRPGLSLEICCSCGNGDVPGTTTDHSSAFSWSRHGSTGLPACPGISRNPRCTLFLGCGSAGENQTLDMAALATHNGRNYRPIGCSSRSNARNHTLTIRSSRDRFAARLKW